MGVNPYAPLPFVYEGNGAFRARSEYFARRCDERFGSGEIVQLVEHHDRSQASHDQQFAWLAEAWKQLPETLADLYPSPAHLRKRALIEAGYYDEEAIDCGTKAAALRVAAHTRSRDDFACVIVRGTIVLIRTAKSQAKRAMNRKIFQESKSAIMEIIAAMIDVPVEQLKAEAGRAA